MNGRRRRPRLLKNTFIFILWWSRGTILKQWVYQVKFNPPLFAGLQVKPPSPWLVIYTSQSRGRSIEPAYTSVNSRFTLVYPTNSSFVEFRLRLICIFAHFNNMLARLSFRNKEKLRIQNNTQLWSQLDSFSFIKPSLLETYSIIAY